MRGAILLLLATITAGILWAQDPAPTTPPDAASEEVKNPVYVCPMDPEVRSHNPGNCPRCGMKLKAGIPDPVEFHLDLTVEPKPIRPGQKVTLRFEVRDPWKGRPVTNFLEIHEKLFHAFVVSQDLEFFLHEHPIYREGAFYYETQLPKAGMYRVLGDFYPDGATPQLIAKTIMTTGAAPRAAKLSRDYETKTSENTQVELTTIPPEPIAGQKTRLIFQVSPEDGLEKYLGAWGHMLAASDDLIDLIHEHPFIADGGPKIEFAMVFPRTRMYRIWAQFQRSGTVNTVHFDIPVQELR